MKGLFTPKDREQKRDDTYTDKALIPQYTPAREKPDISHLIDVSKYGKLVHDIKASNVSEEEKQFLLLGATRHLGFNYCKIADYYAHASKEMQELMEQSALVIIDIDDAIANGYCVLTSKIKQIMDESGVLAGDKDGE